MSRNRTTLRACARPALHLERLDDRILPSTTPFYPIALDLVHRPEYYSRVVGSCYRAYLDRGPTAGEVAGWVAGLQGGLSIEQVEAAFIGSPEFVAKQGGGADWVVGMYTELLGRQPDEPGLADWVSALKGGEPSSIALGFAASAERQGQRIEAIYRTVLSRDPTAGEVAGWVGAFANGVRSEDVLAGFLGSSEYAGRYGNDPALVLTALFGDAVGRQPIESEFAGDLSVLDPTFFDQISFDGYQDDIDDAWSSYLGELDRYDLFYGSALDPDYFYKITLGGQTGLGDGDYLYSDGTYNYYYGGQRLGVIDVGYGDASGGYSSAWDNYSNDGNYSNDAGYGGLEGYGYDETRSKSL